MEVGGVQLTDPLVLSPMVDVTDAAFRSIAREHGADVTCSEMVSAQGILHGNETSWKHVQPWPSEHPYGVQLMGGDGPSIAEAIRRIGDRIQPDFVDLNLGCPSPNILRSCAGGFLLRDPKNAGQIMVAARAACDEAGIPRFSVKLRLGHDHAHQTYLDVGAEAQAAGADWCTLHGRTVVQGYSGEADWSAIARLVEHLDIPVIGNGDLRVGEDVVRMKETTHCAGFFIARAAMHDPTIFGPMRSALEGNLQAVGLNLQERIGLALTYFERAKQIGIDHPADLRRQTIRFLSGVPGAKPLRGLLHETKDVPGMLGVLHKELEGTS